MFKGSIPALVTPMRNGALDEDAFRAFVDWQIEEGSAGLVPVGTTGESPTLSHEEHHRVVEICIEAANKRVPVIAGAGSNNTKEAIELAVHAEKAGADAVLVVTPYYNKPGQQGPVRSISARWPRRSSIPLIIYNIPPRSVVDMSVETMARLFKDCKNIVGVKDATANLDARQPAAACDGAGVQPAVGRGRDGARLHGAWRPRLHLRHRQRRAEALRRIPGGLPRGRLRAGAASTRIG